MALSEWKLDLLHLNASSTSVVCFPTRVSKTSWLCSNGNLHFWRFLPFGDSCLRQSEMSSMRHHGSIWIRTQLSRAPNTPHFSSVSAGFVCDEARC